MESLIASQLKDFVASAYLFRDEMRMPGDTDSLLGIGVLDSTGALELIEFLEERCPCSVLDTEAVPENLGSITGLTQHVLSNRATPDAK